ncbi:MAG: Smr/MutS family protein [Nitrospirae bacterium]|nr:Smr/MutS family protein [Nitrospirota bacterium]
MSERLTYRAFDILRGYQVAKEDIPEPEITDQDCFIRAMERVKEIREFCEIPYPPQAQPTQPKNLSTAINEAEAEKTLTEIISGKRPVEIRNTQEYVEWVSTARVRNHAERKNILNRLHAGQYSVQDYLDLHGYTVKEAESVVQEYIRDSVRRRLSCVKIIHGRGLRSPAGPVIKEALVRWLSNRMRKYVLAFTTARGCDGGLGAVYVLLR